MLGHQPGPSTLSHPPPAHRYPMQRAASDAFAYDSMREAGFVPTMSRSVSTSELPMAMQSHSFRAAEPSNYAMQTSQSQPILQQVSLQPLLNMAVDDELEAGGRVVLPRPYGASRIRPGPKGKGRMPLHKGGSNSPTDGYSDDMDESSNRGLHRSSRDSSVDRSHPGSPIQFGPSLQSIHAPIPVDGMHLQYQTAPMQPLHPEMSHHLLALQRRPQVRSYDAESSQAAALPRNFLETMYTVYLTADPTIPNATQKRFRCLIDGCDRSFPRKSAIHSHIQTHLDDKPFRCPENGW
jgi:hypothetical protein